MAGFIKVHRDIEHNWVWEQKPFSMGQAWIDLILKANYKDNKFLLGKELVDVNRGDIITSELKLADRWGWSRTKIRSFLLLLENELMINRQTDNKKTTISICNYSVWQDSETAKKLQTQQQKNCKKTAKKHNQERKEGKEGKEVKKKIYISAQKLSITEEEYLKLTTKYSKEAVDDKIEHAINYKGLDKKYTSLYLTLNNWLKKDMANKPDDELKGFI